MRLVLCQKKKRNHFLNWHYGVMQAKHLGEHTPEMNQMNKPQSSPSLLLASQAFLLLKSRTHSFKPIYSAEGFISCLTKRHCLLPTSSDFWPCSYTFFRHTQIQIGGCLLTRESLCVIFLFLKMHYQECFCVTFSKTFVQNYLFKNMGLQVKFFIVF